jgi:DNA-binding transcriptional ArsR family regulator
MKISPYQQIGELFEVIGSPTRVQILLAIGAGETCVCHLERLLGLRQAYISQQLMELREKGIIASRREGKFIYYHLEKLEVFDLVRMAARVIGILDVELAILAHASCECPKCKLEG